MPPRKKTEITTDAAEVLNFDAVVKDGGTPDAPAVDDKPGTQETEEHDNGKDELAMLRAELAAAKELLQNRPEAKPAAPKPDAELTPEELEIRKLRDELARAKGKSIESAEELYEENTEGGVLVHFLEDGVTSNGRNFYQGQEVTFGPEAYAQTIDRYGNSWLNLTDDEQYERWGSVKFHKGPWPGKRSYEDAALANVSIAEQAPVLNLSL